MVIGYPSERDFDNMVSSNMIRNFPVAPVGINAANKIFGHNVASLKGKTVCVTQEPVLEEYVEVPKKIFELNKEVTITTDIMFIDGLGFMITASRKIKYTTAD
jgi:hypothetical protein